MATLPGYKNKKSSPVPDDIATSIKAIVDHFEDEDRSVRDRQLRSWRRMKLLWENIHHTYYSEVNHDWRVPDNDRISDDTDQGYYDKPVNVFRAYLESIIAALSVTVPPVTCYPDDADNPLDVTTAKAGDRIAALIFKHNDAPLLWLHALFIFCTEGMVACHTYAKESEDYGTYQDRKYQETAEQHQVSICPFCQAQLGDQVITQDQKDKFQPGPEDAPINNEINKGMEVCPNCGQTMIPDLRNNTVIVTKLIGITDKPKSRVCIDVHGGLNVKVPIWARSQSECSYLIYSYETHYTNVLEMYQGQEDKIEKSGTNYDLYEQWARVSPQYLGEYPVNNVTVREAYLRPASYNYLEKDAADQLRRKFPDGVKACIVNDQVLEAENASMDDEWTLTYNPLSDYVHFDPIGLLLTSVQDITNDLISLTIQTIEHGIPQTFVDPKVLNFNAYRNTEVLPGGIYPAVPKSGKALGESFYEVKTATLSQEVLPFTEKVQEIGQLVSGALPSLFGGHMSGTRTASEYSMSRAQALQRLQSTWKMLLLWWKNIHGKTIPLFIKEMKDDEKQVQRDELGNFVNVFIRKSELEGKIGSVELEANENLPMTWNQQKDVIMELFQLNNPDLLATLTSPENIPYVKKAIGLTDYVVPGEDDRQKQYEEIQLLAVSAPITLPPDPMMVQQAMMAGMPPPPPQNEPSIPVDFDVDNHQVEADICRRWLVSDAGRLCKVENPDGYQNILLHMKMHKDAMMQTVMQQQAAQMQMQPPPASGPPPPNQGGKNDKGSPAKRIGALGIPAPRSSGGPLGSMDNEATVQ